MLYRTKSLYVQRSKFKNKLMNSVGRKENSFMFNLVACKVTKRLEQVKSIKAQEGVKLFLHSFLTSALDGE